MKSKDLLNFPARFLRKLTTRFSIFISRMIKRRASSAELQAYWKEPPDATNHPEKYAEGAVRSQFLVDLISRYIDQRSSILEVGCNIGRNLNALHQAGFARLNGIEINSKAVELMKTTFPQMAQNARIQNGSVENIVKTFKDSEFDLIFTMAVLEHIPYESDWIFAELSRAAKRFIITIEDEKAFCWKNFPRNYRTVFESHSFVQIETMKCENVQGLTRDFVARVFKKS